MNKMEVIYLGIGLLSPDPENIRRSYSPEGLEELAKSIRRWGVRNPLEVQALGAGYQVVSGNRRLLAARLAEVAEVPVKVLTAEEVEAAKELQMIENLQREDLDPLDEAEGYAWLLEHRPGLTLADVAERIGRKVSYVSRRLKLRSAPKDLLAAMRKGLISVRHCELVGAIPDQGAREEATRMVLQPQHHIDPLTTRETERMVRERFFVSISTAPFDVSVPLAGAGPCHACPQLSANAPELADELSLVGGADGGGRRGRRTDLCLAPSCYRKKCQVAWEVVQEQAERSGQTVWGADLAEVFFDGDRVNGHVYADVEDRPSPELVGHYNERKTPTWGEMIKGIPVSTVVVQHPRTLRAHTLVDIEHAMERIEEAAEEAGQESPFAHGRGGRRDDRRGAARRAKEEKAAAFADRVEALKAIRAQLWFTEEREGARLVAEAVVARDAETARWLAAVAGLDPRVMDEETGVSELVDELGTEQTLALWAVATEAGFRAHGARCGLVEVLQATEEALAD